MVDSDKQASQTIQTPFPDKGRAEGLITERVRVLLHASKADDNETDRLCNYTY